MSKHLTVGWLRKVLESYKDDQELEIVTFNERTDEITGFQVTLEPEQSPILEQGDIVRINFDADSN